MILLSLFCTLHPCKTNQLMLFLEYIAEVDRKEQASKEESAAEKLFKEGNNTATNIVDLLTAINNKDHLPLYYAGGFRVITSCLQSVESQSLYRTNGGLKLPSTHDLLKRCVSSNLVSLSKEERDLLTAALDMFTAACRNNETSQQQLLALPQFPNQLLAMLEAKFKGQGRLLKTSILNLLHELSLTSAGRTAIVELFDIARLVTILFYLMVSKSTYASVAAALLNNIALDKRLKAKLKNNIQEEIIPAFEFMLQSKQISPTIAGLASSAATNLAGDVTIRKKMASRNLIWKSVSDLLISYTISETCAPMEHLLGLLVNLSTGVDSLSLQNVSSEVTLACCNIMTSKKLSDLAVGRAVAVASNLIQHSEKSFQTLCDNERPMVVMEFMKSPDPQFYKSALKCMAKLTQNREVATNLVDNKVTSVLLNFLNNEDEVVIGNATLSLSHLCDVDKFCAKLTKTNVIQKLLILARDGRKPAVQSNCAILIGKLVKGDSRHLERLRELHGIEILHACMKHVK